MIIVNTNEMENNESYDLGQLAGEIIELKYLPTLETDMIKTNNVVKVDDNERIENKRLSDILEKTYKFNGGIGDSTQKHKDWLDHVYVLSEKYLPKKLECRITKVNPTDMVSFKEGLNEYLWNTDLSWYTPEDDFFEPNHELAWCSTIILTRSDNSKCECEKPVLQTETKQCGRCNLYIDRVKHILLTDTND